MTGLFLSLLRNLRRHPVYHSVIPPSHPVIPDQIRDLFEPAMTL
jgi:hypothetical protein